MFFSSPPEISDVKLEGKTVIVTGANSGIGFITAVDLAKRGAKVIIGCRNVELGEKAVSDIKEQSKNDNIYLIQLDLASLESVRKFAKEFLEKENQLHILVNNAGIMALPERQLSKDGYEMQFAVNHLGHFLLTKLLLDTLKTSAPSRVVNVSSSAHSFAPSTFNFDDMNLDKGYSAWSAYGRSKVSNILFTKELHKRYNADGISSFCLHPGAIATNLGRHSLISKWYFAPVKKVFFLTPEQGAMTQIFCAVQPDIESLSGEYFVKRMKKEPSALAKNPETAEKLWNVSEEMVVEKPKENLEKPNESAEGEKTNNGTD